MCLAISSDGRRLLTGDPANNASLWSLDTDEVVEQFSSDAPIAAVDFSPVDDNIVLSGSYDGSVRIWNVHKRQSLGPPLRHGALVRCAGFSADGKVVFSGSTDAVQLVGLSDASRTLSRPVRAPVHPIAFDRRRDSVLVRDGDTLQLVSALSGRQIGESLPSKGRIISAACDAEVSRAVVIGRFGVATLWDVETGESIARLTRRREPALSVAFGEQGLVAVGFFDGAAMLFDARTGTPVNREFAHISHTGPVFSIDFHGDRMLTGGADGYARLWNMKTGQLIHAIHHPTYCIAAFSADGSRIATSGADQATRVWSVDGKLITAPLRHPSQAWLPEFSDGGDLLLTGCSDGKARLWDVATARQLGPPMPHTQESDARPSIGVAFWPDQRTVMTSTGPSNMALEEHTTRALYHDIPTTIEGDARDLTLWIETITGMTLDDQGAANVLSVDGWRERREQLMQRTSDERSER